MNAQPLLNHRYRIVKALGEGGFGRTSLAEDTHMPSQQRCVIKQLKPLRHRPEIHKVLQDRFAREAAVLETVGKSNNQIPTLYAYFIRRSEFYLVQEWIEGETLNAYSHGTVETVSDLLVSLLKTLAYIHRHNIIHRDIKPENIIVRSQDRTPCLIDFGAVKEVMSTVLSPSGALKTSLVIGTPGFMPPEQMAGHPVFASDLYSLGLTMVSLLTKRSPTEIPTDSRTGEKLWQQYAKDVPKPLATVLAKATHEQASHRYATADEMLAELMTAKPQAVKKVPSAFGNIPPQPTASSRIATTEVALSSSPSKSRRKLITPLATIGLAIASLTGLSLFFLFGARLKIVSNRPTAASIASQNQASRPVNSTDSELPIEPATAQNSNDGLAIARSLFNEGKNEAALTEIDQILERNPDRAAAIALKADIFANQTQRDLPGAIELYAQAISLEPDNVDFFSKRCKTYAALQNWPAAEADCTQAISLDPSNANLYGRRGDIHMSQENYESAVDDYTQAIEINASAGKEPQSQSLYFRRFTALGELDRAGEALADLEKVRTFPPTESTAE